MAEQNYSNHTRWNQLFHFVVQPLLVLNFLSHLVRFIMAPSYALGFWTLLGVALILLAISARLQALKAQDRLIRLEERLRYKELLTPELAAKASNLRVGQIIALRFASDAELAGLVERTLNGEFASTKEIKQAIKDWRADYLRL
ncbi:MAG: hypothetical protein IPI64_08585 [Chloracidobacterium sp.]|nr:hypothetical protein [Chloracidobacterium sp.]